MEVAEEEGRETVTMMLTLGGGVRLSLGEWVCSNSNGVGGLAFVAKSVENLWYILLPGRSRGQRNGISNTAGKLGVFRVCF